MAALFREGEPASGGFGNLHAFGRLNRTCDPELLLGGTHETLARALHEDYVRIQTPAGENPRENPSLVSWDELSDDRKEWNRRRSDRIGGQLKAVACSIVPLTDWDAGLFKFAPEEIELMSMMEHESWMRDRIPEGWIFAPGLRNDRKKTNPLLVPWGQLQEDEKEKNRGQIRELPPILARAGFQIHRREVMV
jgi:hypothetical protein